jgi:hypothetical protein
MSVGAINQAAGADLLTQLTQSASQGAPPPSAVTAALKIALAKAQINLAALIGDAPTGATTNQINILV